MEIDPQFSLKQVEAILSEMFRIHPDKRATFSARLQQLQRLGLPRGAKPGRGVRFRYAYWQLAELAFCCDLLDVGVPPHLIQTHFAAPGLFSQAGQGESVERAADMGVPDHIFIKLHALNYLRSGTMGASEHAADHELRFRPAGVMTEATNEPAIVIDLADRMRSLKAAVARVMPKYAGVQVFPPTPPIPGKIA